MKLADLTGADVEALRWYYQVELLPGHFTIGRPFRNMRVTRRLLDRINLSGVRMLDVGAQEGAFAVLSARSGADVVAYDRFNLTERINLVKEAHGVAFDYRPGQTFHDFVESWRANGGEQFDFVLCSGVLYHVIEPMLFLYYLRAMLKPGGAMVIETSVAVEVDAAMYFNEKGRFFAATNFYQVSSGWLDCALRYLGFRITDYAFIDSGDYDGRRIVRLALTCQYEGEPVLEPDDEWGLRRHYEKELAEYLPDFEVGAKASMASRIKPGTIEDAHWRTGVRSLDVTRAINEGQSMRYNKAACRLTLEDRLLGGA